MKKKLHLILGLMLVLSLALTACNGSTTNKDTSNSKVENNQTTNALPTKDRAGNDITIPEDVKSIVTLAPSTSQVLAEIGVQDKVVGVDTQTAGYISDLSSLPQIDMMNPDCEAIIALKPDVVFVTGMSNVGAENPFKAVKDAGICVIEIPSSNSVDGVMEDIQFIADCLKKSDEGTKLVEDMKNEINKIKEIGDTIKAEDQKTVLFEIAAAPDIYSFGSDVYLNELLSMVGAKNVLADQSGWLPVTEEAAITANPDVILTNVNYIENPVEEILARKGWENVTAVKNKAVYSIDNTASSLPNHNIIQALKEIAKAVYPEQYANID